MKRESFVINSKNIMRDSYVWNMAGSMLQAFQSVIMLMALMRTVGLIQSGIFTIAYANANLFLNIGKYGMRNYQVSDVQEQFSFHDYLRSRTVTVLLMVVVSFIYIGIAAQLNHYSVEKVLIIACMCIYKAADAIEDVYHGMFQQKGRLDIASKALTIRTLITIIVFVTGLILFQNQLLSLVVATAFTYILMIYFLKLGCSSFTNRDAEKNNRNCIILLGNCFPIFVGSFLSFYIGNAPKYAIDAHLSDELQACYGFIAMPVFVIGLLNNFVFNPILNQMAYMWENKEYARFIRRVLGQIGIIVLITAVCMAGAFLLGIPVLSWLYSTDLTGYREELLILLLGGGLLGLSGFFNAIITIMRFQSKIAFIYSAVAVLAFVLSNPVVCANGITGATMLYTFLMGVLCVLFIVLFVICIYRGVKNGGKNKEQIQRDQ